MVESYSAREERRSRCYDPTFGLNGSITTLNMCVPQQPEQRNWLMDDPTFGLNGSITTAEACRAAGGHFKPHLSEWMIRVYPFETNPVRVWGVGMGDDHGMEHNSMPGTKM